MAATIQEILDTLIASEKANDAVRWLILLAEDFRFIGPIGFVITSEQFAGRFDGGALKTTRFALTNVDVREHEGTAVAFGVWTQKPASRAVRTTATSGSPGSSPGKLTAGTCFMPKLSPMMVLPA